MTKKTNHSFRTYVTDLSLNANAEAALDAAHDAYMENPDKRGSVLCQIHREIGAGVTITGAFIEHEYADRINEILKERRDAYQSANAADSERETN